MRSGAAGHPTGSCPSAILAGAIDSPAVVDYAASGHHPDALRRDAFLRPSALAAGPQSGQEERPHAGA